MNEMEKLTAPPGMGFRTKHSGPDGGIGPLTRIDADIFVKEDL
jgi:hypothetical protein